MSTMQTIGWETGCGEERTLRLSAMHILNEDTGKTACGKAIPSDATTDSHGNGTWCKACRKSIK